ncbi:helix-turn-helix domain-containing protein [Bacillus testis]|uniref:helix-turn-helix domain-containing protein n=1 Tax=Bacillus testis TaxID=1622072 RepID=UPI0009463377|nr:helix-turn-helix domain-containing protein [Bacillus testis]
MDFSDQTSVYSCSNCSFVFGVVLMDSLGSLNCPKCGGSSKFSGSGYLTYSLRTKDRGSAAASDSTQTPSHSMYPLVLTAEDIADILSISTHGAYALMKEPGFPCVTIGRLKRVGRDAFFNWLSEYK